MKCPRYGLGFIHKLKGKVLTRITSKDVKYFSLLLFSLSLEIKDKTAGIKRVTQNPKGLSLISGCGEGSNFNSMMYKLRFTLFFLGNFIVLTVTSEKHRRVSMCIYIKMHMYV